MAQNSLYGFAVHLGSPAPEDRLRLEQELALALSSHKLELEWSSVEPHELSDSLIHLALVWAPIAEVQNHLMALAQKSSPPPVVLAVVDGQSPWSSLALSWLQAGATGVIHRNVKASGLGEHLSQLIQTQQFVPRTLP